MSAFDDLFHKNDAPCGSGSINPLESNVSSIEGEKVGVNGIGREAAGSSSELKVDIMGSMNDDGTGAEGQTPMFSTNEMLQSISNVQSGLTLDLPPVESHPHPVPLLMIYQAFSGPGGQHGLYHSSPIFTDRPESPQTGRLFDLTDSSSDEDSVDLEYLKNKLEYFGGLSEDEFTDITPMSSVAGSPSPMPPFDFEDVSNSSSTAATWGSRSESGLVISAGSPSSVQFCQFNTSLRQTEGSTDLAAKMDHEQAHAPMIAEESANHDKLCEGAQDLALIGDESTAGAGSSCNCIGGMQSNGGQGQRVKECGEEPGTSTEMHCETSEKSPFQGTMNKSGAPMAQDQGQFNRDEMPRVDRETLARPPRMGMARKMRRSTGLHPKALANATSQRLKTPAAAPSYNERTKQQKKIEQENMILSRRLQSVKASKEISEAFGSGQTAGQGKGTTPSSTKK